ncbi:MAG: hypothetical protein HOP08_02165 [Cyclobacteriaceae bacterium]|nr:hypothetical protein [Cyclobacteriaceae bacterium]
MLRNYLVVALRNLKRQFSYSIINIFGLAIGIACSLVMFLFVYNEWSYDRHYKNADRIFKIGVSFFNMGNFGPGPEVLGEYLPKEFEGVEAFTRILRSRETPLSIGDKTFDEMVYYTDSSFFKVFSYEFLEGNRDFALSTPDQAVITQRMARKYFGDAPALGKVIEVGKERTPFTVSGIVKDDDRSSQLKATLWLSIDHQLKNSKIWTSASVFNYVLLKENNGREDLDNALDRIMEKQVYPSASSAGMPPNISFEDYKKNENALRFNVHALKDVHLKSSLNYEISTPGNESNMYTFAAISVFILLLASVNFINLTTARASRRGKEVGIRKSIGSGRSKLVIQFILESVIVSLIAMLLSLALAEMFLKVFEIVTGTQLINTLWNSGWSLLILLAFAVLVGFISGIYPAFYLTSFTPIKVLKGNIAMGGGSQFRNLLVIFQFSISICLMICSTIIVRQMNFMQTKDMGFTQENMITIDNVGALKQHADAFKNELSQMSGVLKSSLHTGEPGSKAVMSFYTFQTPEMKDPVAINTYFGDAEYIGVMEFKLLQGRSFNKDIASDSAGVVLNESAVESLGLKEPIGAVINKDLHVIGVVSDFHWESLRNSIAPVAILLSKNNYYQLGFRVEPGAAGNFISKAEVKWKSLVADEPFKYHFLDDNFGELLEKEQVFSKAIGFFTVLAIFISCLGLYGLSAFTAEQRTKEIGIRKVLGATAVNIVSMLNKKFTILVCISIFIATPVSLYFMLKWMEGFAYKSELSLWTFIIVSISAIVIALTTVSFHSLKAATVNPANTLKYE